MLVLVSTEFFLASAALIVEQPADVQWRNGWFCKYKSFYYHPATMVLTRGLTPALLMLF